MYVCVDVKSFANFFTHTLVVYVLLYNTQLQHLDVLCYAFQTVFFVTEHLVHNYFISGFWCGKLMTDNSRYLNFMCTYHRIDKQQCIFSK